MGTGLHVVVDLVAAGAIKLGDFEQDVGDEVVDGLAHPRLEEVGVFLGQQVLHEPHHAQDGRPECP